MSARRCLGSHFVELLVIAKIPNNRKAVRMTSSENACMGVRARPMREEHAGCAAVPHATVMDRVVMIDHRAEQRVDNDGAENAADQLRAQYGSTFFHENRK